MPHCASHTWKQLSWTPFSRLTWQHLTTVGSWNRSNRWIIGHIGGSLDQKGDLLLHGNKNLAAPAAVLPAAGAEDPSDPAWISTGQQLSGSAVGCRVSISWKQPWNSAGFPSIEVWTSVNYSSIPAHEPHRTWRDDCSKFKLSAKGWQQGYSSKLGRFCRGSNEIAFFGSSRQGIFSVGTVKEVP